MTAIAARVAIAVAMAIVSFVAIVAVSRDVLDRAGGWAMPALLATCLVLAAAVPSAHPALPSGGFPVLVLAVGAAAYACVPETDPLLALAIVPVVAAVTELVGRRPVPLLATWATTSLVLWAGVHGATGRASALVGALFAWWPLALAAALTAVRWHPQGLVRWAVVLAPAWAATVVVARSGALRATVEPAFTAVAVAAPVSLTVTLAVAYPLRRGRAQRAG